MGNKIKIIYGDITKIIVDAIVNAANSSLLGGSGVDGAIHKAGGKEVLEACQKIRSKQGKCKTGNAVITAAGNLPAQYIIHTVGPFWSGGNNNEIIDLKNCYINCLKLAQKFQIETISFPNISTGIYKFPKELAANIALSTIKEEIKLNSHIKQVSIVCFEKQNYDIYTKLLESLK